MYCHPLHFVLEPSAVDAVMATWTKNRLSVTWSYSGGNIPIILYEYRYGIFQQTTPTQILSLYPLVENTNYEVLIRAFNGYHYGEAVLVAGATCK